MSTHNLCFNIVKKKIFQLHVQYKLCYATIYNKTNFGLFRQVVAYCCMKVVQKAHA